MQNSPEREFRANLSEVIGVDIVNVTASDDARHFDPMLFVQLYSGMLLLLFVKGVAEGAGKKTGELIAQKVADSINTLKNLVVNNSDDETQLKEIQKANTALKDIHNELGASYLEEFVMVGKQAIEQRLLRDNFPKRKAAKISEQFAEKIRQRITS